ncbi:MAG: xanthine dehydrogenase family protein subunit M [Hyphomicrobiales bacterium]|nr:xanthine dehydrogenase family protein subunit M [Hyphomicrobiales bacterium]
MKARNFHYVRPSSLEHAYRVLSEGGDEIVPIAGGQSLLASLNMRLSAPKLLLDIGELPELSGMVRVDDGIRLGALTRHRELLESGLIRHELPLLAQAATHVGHVAIRNRGTLGGSLANADPAAELPACAVALGATLVLGSLAGEREVSAEQFFKGLFETDLAPGELIIAVRFPLPTPDTAVAFGELTRRSGDFALAGLAAVAKVERDRIASARLVYLGCVDRAQVAQTVSAAIVGVQLPLQNDAVLADAIGRDVSPSSMPGLRADTRLKLATVLTRRVVNSLSPVGTVG